MIDRRKPLSFLITANQLRRDGVMVPAVPFVADVEPGDMPCRITEVRERVASWTSLLDERKSGSINLSNVLVDPDDIEWVARLVLVPPVAESLSLSDRVSDPSPAPEPATEHHQQPTHMGEESMQNRISVAEREALKAKGLKRCFKCHRDMAIADLNTGGFCRDGKSCAAARNGETAVLASTASPTSATIAPVKEKRKYVRKGKPSKKARRIAPREGKTPGKAASIPPAAVTVSASSVGLLAQVRTLRKERDDARAELAAHLADLQEVLAGA